MVNREEPICCLSGNLEGIPWGCAKSSIENNPKADWVCVPIVSATDKPAVAPMYVRITRYYAVNKNCKNPEAIFKLANEFQDKINSIDSDEETLNTFGVDPKTGANLAILAAFILDSAIQKCNTYYSEIKSVFDGKSTVDQIHPEAARYYKVMKEFVDSGYDKTNSLGWNYYKFIGPEGSWNTIINDYKANNRTTESLFFGAPTATMSKLIVSGSIMLAYVDDVALSTRCYSVDSGSVGIFVEYGKINCRDTKLLGQK